MLRPSLRRDPRIVPLVAAAVMGLLGLVETYSDPTFRPHAGALAVAAAWVAGGFVVASRLPSVGAVVVAAYYPLSLALGAPGPGGTGLIAVLVA
jgi:hypothetical protein